MLVPKNGTVLCISTGSAYEGSSFSTSSPAGVRVGLFDNNHLTAAG